MLPSSNAGGGPPPLPKMAWETAAGPTTLAAPDGSSVVQKQAAISTDKNMGSMWNRVQCAPAPSPLPAQRLWLAPHA